ncbi:MAG: isoprenoid biosynthesis glyoxalase ElbB [Oligoflexia bacterium]|nr:isoprenoid biosynthesis glyoxalase ElbB [Oligoflexia bacterium]
MKKKVAVILCGSGFKDGSEIRESVAALLALSELGASAQCFAPDAPQADVVNCLTGQSVPGEARDMRVEAARIARGEVRSLSELDPGSIDALILPGGFGAAKNLCSFAREGARGSVREDLQKALERLHARGKPIGAICIAPAIVALAFRGKGFELTVGEAGETAAELEKLGHRHVTCAVDDCHVDARNRVVTAPAYMYGDAPLHSVFAGIRKLVAEVLALS